MTKPMPSPVRKKPAQVDPAAAPPTPATPRPPAFSAFSDAVAYLYDRVDLERRRIDDAARREYRLDRMRAILHRLGNPHESLRCVHVAGTKGKGSTCEMAASCLEACGYTVGAYTSPHLVDIRERVRINRAEIPRDDFVRLARQAALAAHDLLPEHGPATFFELMTALGFLHFAEQAVDVAVIEVGLGGLLDCTNVITPDVAAVATIGRDHTAILGDTLEEIALQKAGIFKPGVPALAINQDSKILAVMKAYAEQIGAPFQVVGKDIDFSHRFEHQAGVGPLFRVSLTTERSTYEHLPVPLKGEHQALNCGLALAILDQLAARGFACPEPAVTRGLQQVRLPGRFELVHDAPRILLDGAHNAESVTALIKAIGAHLQYDSLVAIFGCAADKDIDAMLKSLSLGADKVIFTRASANARAADPADLQRRFEAIAGKMSQTAPDFPAALDLAARAVGRGDVILVTGSFYLLGDAKRHWAARAEARATPPKRR